MAHVDTVDADNNDNSIDGIVLPEERRALQDLEREHTMRKAISLCLGPLS